MEANEQNIQVGDVCTIVSTPCSCAACQSFVGRQCTVVEGEQLCSIPLGPFAVRLIHAFLINIDGEGNTIFAYERRRLRKDPPPADDANTVTSLARFNEWLERVRQGGRIHQKEPA